MGPAQTDISTPCPKCAGVMKILAVERVMVVARTLQPTFVCAVAVKRRG